MHNNSIVIGVAFRTESRGASHEVFDTYAMQQLSRLTQDNFITVSLPEGARGASTPQRVLDPKILRSSLLKVDALFIPGGRSANPTQVAPVRADNIELDATGDYKNPERCQTIKDAHRERLKKEVESRDPYERALIKMAHNMGVPILCVCAGTWRLAQTYGGVIEELPKIEKNVHYNQAWEVVHAVTFVEGTDLSAIASRIPNDQKRVNSLHWAAVKYDVETGHLVAKNAQDFNDAKILNPNDWLTIAAFDNESNISHHSVEALEGKRGAPMWGLQFHPEAVMLEDSAVERAFFQLACFIVSLEEVPRFITNWLNPPKIQFKQLSLAIMKAFAQSAKAAHNKKRLQAEILARGKRTQ